MQKLTRIVTLSAALLLASGCSYFGVYKRDILQGNLVTADMVEQLRPGMTRDDVVYVMGRPLLEAPFDANQWDYVFYLDKAYGGVERRRVTLTFDGNRLVDIRREGNLERDIDLRASEGAGPQVEGAEPLETTPEPQSEGGATVPMGGEPARDF
ncbi:outer membrane protein assembly factor BamE [Halomonas sp. A11-A]|uniref:outer membrane protein assembly factor BamE n=1 Tax=Halomonas sp. A11-A TaxID=2183985 RepID=UPI000D9240DB|nr:outer membrane protein assembly factor BamE [Halomonas sp. A11-A]PWV73003.1 outer membrane protein assembly factor BamE (lipoprotein component of BamABCDE complex) [Halomonas sp. A11-A]